MTKIEWTDETWNPVTGCTKISEGCQNCYAERMAKRLAGRYGYPKDDPFKVTIHKDKLWQPKKWRKPRRVFVCSMGDLFHEDGPGDFVIEVLRVIYNHPQHTFIFLTKRPKIMAEIMGIYYSHYKLIKNLWLGVTVENQKRADERIPILLQIPAAIRFVSIEPMLGPVDLEKAQCNCPWPDDAIRTRHLLDCPADRRPHTRWSLDWVICGCESGPNRRPTQIDWIRNIKDQCFAAEVPFFLKQANGYINGKSTVIKMPMLDGKVWDQYPT